MTETVFGATPMEAVILTTVILVIIAVCFWLATKLGDLAFDAADGCLLPAMAMAVALAVLAVAGAIFLAGLRLGGM